MPYTVREHTGELELEVHAPSLEALFAEAALALSAELLGGAPGRALSSEREVREVESSGADDEALLVDLLNEIVFLSESEGFLADAAAVREHSQGKLRIDLTGKRYESLYPLVKAATYHNLAIARRPAADGTDWRASVVLDV